MTFTGRVPDYIEVTTTPAQAWGVSTKPSHPVGTLEVGVVGDGGGGHMDDRCREAVLRARIADLEAMVREQFHREVEVRAHRDRLWRELRELRRNLDAMMAIGRLSADRLDVVAAHGPDDGQEDFSHPVVDLTGIEAERLFPG